MDVKNRFCAYIFAHGVKTYWFNQSFGREHQITIQSHANGLFTCPLKTENLRFSGVFRGYKKKSVPGNGLVSCCLPLPDIFKVLWQKLFSQKYHWFKIFKTIINKFFNIAILLLPNHWNIILLIACFYGSVMGIHNHYFNLDSCFIELINKLL